MGRGPATSRRRRATGRPVRARCSCEPPPTCTQHSSAKEGMDSEQNAAVRDSSSGQSECAADFSSSDCSVWRVGCLAFSFCTLAVVAVAWLAARLVRLSLRGCSGCLCCVLIEMRRCSGLCCWFSLSTPIACTAAQGGGGGGAMSVRGRRRGSRAS